MRDVNLYDGILVARLKTIISVMLPQYALSFIAFWLKKIIDGSTIGNTWHNSDDICIEFAARSTVIVPVYDISFAVVIHTHCTRYILIVFRPRLTQSYRYFGVTCMHILIKKSTSILWARVHFKYNNCLLLAPLSIDINLNNQQRIASFKWNSFTE